MAEMYKAVDAYTAKMTEKSAERFKIDPKLYGEYGVKRGLRDVNGKGVLAGLTGISSIQSGIETEDGTVPIDGRLEYRGYDINELVNGCVRRRSYAFEEIAYLLLFGSLPAAAELSEFSALLSSLRTLPTNFVRDVVMKAPSKDIMNTLTRSILTLSSYDERACDLSLSNTLRQCLMLISELPMLAVYGYHAYNYYMEGDSFYIHRPSTELSFAQNLLMMLRPDKAYTETEARVMDIALVLHMEHGGGNNSSFTTRVVTSAGSDTYSVIAAALSSLKGPKHGGANIKVVEMMSDLKSRVRDLRDEGEVGAYLERLLGKEEFDRKGLIYGMGHAVYTLSDPREVILRGFVEKLASEKGRHDDYELYSMVERLAPEVISKNRRIYKGVCANVDFYSGFVYSMLGIPEELYTPIFAMARMVGWSAHRMEELINGDKIIRPAYKSVVPHRDYESIEKRD